MIIHAAMHPNYAERSTFLCPDTKYGRNIHILTASMFYRPLLIIGVRAVHHVRLEIAAFQRRKLLLGRFFYAAAGGGAYSFTEVAPSQWQRM